MKHDSLNTTKDTSPSLYKNETAKKTRSSNLELYRIVCMIMIVAHHFVVNSGLITEEGGRWQLTIRVVIVYFLHYWERGVKLVSTVF